MKKKAKPTPREVSEEVVPVTMEEKLKGVLADTLKEAGVARTAAITLAELDYAEHLSDAIKKHYEDIEALYSSVQKSLKGKASDKELNQILKKVEDKAQATKKFQARFAQSPTCEAAVFMATYTHTLHIHIYTHGSIILNTSVYVVYAYLYFL